MIVCPGCGGRNAPEADACAFCKRRTAVPARAVVREHDTSAATESLVASAARAATVRKVLLAVLVLLLVGILLVLRSSALGGAG
jgi:hypothetical protein